MFRKRPAKPQHRWRDVLRGEFRSALLPYLGFLLPWTAGVVAAWNTRSAISGLPRTIVLVVFGIGWLAGLSLTAELRSRRPRWQIHALRGGVCCGTALWSGWLFLPTGPTPKAGHIDLAALPFGLPAVGLAALLWWSLLRPRLMTWLLGIAAVPVLTIMMVLGCEAILAWTDLVRTLRAVEDDWWTSGAMLPSFILLLTTGSWFIAARWRRLGAHYAPGSLEEHYLARVETDEDLRGLTGHPPAILALMWLAGAPLAFFMAVFDMQKGGAIRRYRRQVERYQRTGLRSDRPDYLRGFSTAGPYAVEPETAPDPPDSDPSKS